MLRCADDSVYTGVTTDVARRLNEHKNADRRGKGAKFLRGKQPLRLIYHIGVSSRSQAQKLEYAIKQLNKAEKESIVRQQWDLLQLESQLVIA